METLVYTSAQWHSTSLLNKIIQAGVLCAEIETSYKVKLKIGNGKDRWIDLPYIPDLNGYYTKEEINAIINDINVQIAELEKAKHTHDNKAILDKITKEFTIEDKEKLDSLTPYDDKEVEKRLTNLEKDSHTHKNKTLLDKTTAVFTVELEEKINQSAGPFTPATYNTDGSQGLVPAPKAGDNIKFLRGDGNWVGIDEYVLPVASSRSLGGVKIGANINITADGVISVAPPDHYTLPIASAVELGGIKIGDGLSIDANGVVSTTGITVIPPATTTTIGGVIIGEGINVDEDGVISVTESPYELPPATDETLGGVIIGDGVEVDENGVISVPEYIAGTGLRLVNTESDLPVGYTKLDYVTCNGNQYINTGYYGNQNTVFEVGVSTTDTSHDMPIMGARKSYSQQQFVCWFGGIYSTNDTTGCLYVLGNYMYSHFTRTLLGVTRGYRVNCVFTTHSLSVDGNVLWQDDEVFDVDTTDPIYLGACNQNGSPYSQYFIGNIYDFVIRENGTIIKHYIPCKNSSNLVGFYETESETFVQSITGTPFIAGPESSGGGIGSKRFDNTGVLDVSLNQSDNTVLDVEFMDETTHIQLPTYDEYSAGTGIEFESTSSRLPAAYQEIEWAESTSGGNQYIDTGYYPNATSRFVTKALMYTDYSVFGCYQRYNLTGSGSTLRYYTGDHSSRNYSNRIDLTPHVYDIGGTYVMLDDEVLDTFTQSSYQSTDTMFLFGRSSGSQLNDSGRVRIYYFKIYDDGTLIRDYVPCYRKSDNVVGLYDLVYDVFYTTPTGSFTAGPDVSGGGDGTYVINNTGVLDVSLNQSDNTILDVEFADETKHIQLPSSGVQEEYTAGEGISIIRNTDDIIIPVYYDNFETGDIDPSTGLNISIIGYDIIRTNNFTVFISDDDSVATTANIYDSDDASLLWRMFFYQGDGTFISATNNWNQNDDSITIPTNAKWIKLTVKRSDGSELVITDLGSCNIILSGDVKNVISIKKATASTLGGVRVGDDLVIDNTGRLSVDPLLIQRIETMEEHDVADTDDMIIHVNS